MIVVRYTWKVNHIRQSEFIELVKAAVEEAGLTPRICSYVFGPTDTVTSDLEYETIEDWVKRRNDWDRSQPAFAEFLKKYPDLAEIGMTTEVLQVY